MNYTRRLAKHILSSTLAALIGMTLVGPYTTSAAAEQTDTRALAERLIERGGIDRGLCALLGGDGHLALDIVQGSHLLVHLREPKRSVVTAQQRLAAEKGLGITRLVVEQGSLKTLPYADNTVDVVMATQRNRNLVDSLSLAEILRVLRPEGIALFCAARSTEKQVLRQWIQADPVLDAKIWQDKHGTWLHLTKPPMAGVDEWTHWEHRPDNNPVSTDQVIKAPYMTQFLAEPYYIAMPAITTAAGGRTFLATGHIAHHSREWDTVNKLIARNGYNGMVLWERDLADGYMAHRSAFIATKDIFYLMDGDSCLKLDARTGRERGRIRIPALEGEWKWMALEQGVLYVLTGDKGGKAKVIKGDRNFGGWSWADLSEGYYQRPRVPWGFGTRLAAFRLDDQSLLWQHQEDALIDSRALALRDDRLYLYCPGKYLRGLNARTADHLWTNGDTEVLDLIEEPGRGLTSTPGFRSACMTVATPKALIIQGQTRMNTLAVSTTTGKLLWKKEKISNNPNVILVDGQAVLGIGPRSTHVTVDPVTGSVLDNLGFRKAACTRLTASPDSLFVRGEGTLRFDRASKRVLVDGGVRPACNDGVIAANGMLYIGPWACDCNLSLIGAMAKCSAGDFRFDRIATEVERLQREPDAQRVTPLKVTRTDWPTYRANNQRTASTRARLARPNTDGKPSTARSWVYTPKHAHANQRGARRD